MATHFGPPEIIRQPAEAAIGRPVVDAITAVPAHNQENNAQDESRQNVEGTSLHLVLDQSSSMQNMNASAYSGALELVRDLEESSFVTITTFSTTVTLGTRQPRAVAIDTLTCDPLASGRTALYDALVAVDEAELSGPAGQTTVVIVTDGEDTASTASLQQARSAIERLKSRNAKVFFLGANIDAIAVGSRLGVAQTNALNFLAADEQIQVAFRAASDVVRNNRAGFTQVQRQASVATDSGSSHMLPPLRRSRTVPA